MTNRAAPGMRLGAGLATAMFAATLVPAAVVATLLWPGTASSSTEPAPPSTTAPSTAAHATAPLVPPALDFDGLEKLARAPTATSTASIAFDKPRVDAERLLLKKMAHARDARREAGGTLQDLRKPFSVDDLGGAAGMTELGVAAGKRYLVSRDGKLVAPAGAALPAVDLASHERDEDVLETTGALDGKTVRVLRRCVAGELMCVVDVAEAAPAASGDDALVAAIGKERDKLRAWTAAAAATPDAATPPRVGQASLPAIPSTAPASTAHASLVAPSVAAALGALVALVLAALLASRLRAISGLVVAAAGRLRAAGRVAPANAARVPGEIAELERAIDDAVAAFAAAEARAGTHTARSARLDVVAASLTAAQTRIAERVPRDDGDELGVRGVVDAANGLIEAFESRVVRWRSHIDTVTAPAAVSSIEARAHEIAAVPPVMLETAQRLLRLSRVQNMPQKLVDELSGLGNALAERGQSALVLVEQLQLDAATDRKGERPTNALESLRTELAALAPSTNLPATVQALADLGPAEIARRLDESAPA